MIHNAHPLTLCADKAETKNQRIGTLFAIQWLLSWLLHKGRIRLSVANLSSENDFLLNALLPSG